MAEGLSSCLPIAMRMVGDAIRLDSQNCKKVIKILSSKCLRSILFSFIILFLKEAYCQYLSCCVYISQILKDDTWDKGEKSPALIVIIDVYNFELFYRY